MVWNGRQFFHIPYWPGAYAGFFNGIGFKSDIKNLFAIYALANKLLSVMQQNGVKVTLCVMQIKLFKQQTIKHTSIVNIIRFATER